MIARLWSSKRRRVIVAAGAVVLVSMATILAVANSALLPESGPAVDTHVPRSDIYTVDVTTGELTQETNLPDDGELEPSYSPQGEIIFSSVTCDECDATIMQVEPGPGPPTEVPIPANVQELHQPSWAPDGRRVATVALGRGIFAVDSQTGQSTQLTSGSADEAPDWSPVRDLVLFHRQVTASNYDIFSVNAANGRERRLTNDRKQQTNAAWSPDGTRVAFAEQRDNGLWSIVTMNSNGSQRKRITPPTMSAQEPSWSPDGAELAVILQEAEQATVAIMPADGSAPPRRVTDETIYPSKPSWSPDGDNIAFAATVVPEP